MKISNISFKRIFIIIIIGNIIKKGFRVISNKKARALIV